MLVFKLVLVEVIQFWNYDQIEVVPDGKYGNYIPETKKWDGLVLRLLERKADMAVADMSITYERKTAGLKTQNKQIRDSYISKF